MSSDAIAPGTKPHHGHRLEPALHALLRSEVPAEALDWVEHATGARVIGQQPLEGGTSSAVHLLTLDATPPEDRVVLRRYVLDWVVEEADVPGNEALALQLIAGNTVGVAAPRLVASDPHGVELGVPATLMSAVPGTPVWHPVDRSRFLRSLAELAVRIHRQPVSARQAEWAPYPPGARTAPAWSRVPQAWLTAYELWDGPPPPSERVFLHRDFHPGNVLWTGDQITGVIDWVSSCAGPPEEDIGHCRANLAILHGQESADEFLACWQHLTGRTEYHPYWDLTNVVSFDHAQVEPRLDAFVEAAAARMG